MKTRITLILSITFLSALLLTCSKKQDSYNAELDQLKSLPYITWTENEVDNSVTGVMKYDKKRSFPGYNLFTNKRDKAYLMDMNGVVVHEWNLPYVQKGIWEYAVLKENGNLIAECVDCPQIGAMEVDWNSQPVWVSDLRFHHDIEILPDGSCLIPDRIMIKYKSRNVNFDRIIYISKAGEVRTVWSSLDVLEELQQYHEPLYLDTEPDSFEIEEKSDAKYDYYHLNTIKVLPFTWLGVFDKRFREGNWLICLRNTNLIIILDKDTKEVVWHWGPGELEWPHMPVMLDNGEILIFDNGVGREYTRVVQVNPRTNKITWEYKTDPPQLFYSFLCGSAQRFSNGNTLITNADNGHVFEVTKKGETVWEFYHFEIEGRYRKTIYRMIKYPDNLVKKLLKKYQTVQAGRIAGW